MHEVQGGFCKSVNPWLIGKIATGKKTRMRAESEVNWAGWGCSHRAKAWWRRGWRRPGWIEQAGRGQPASLAAQSTRAGGRAGTSSSARLVRKQSRGGVAGTSSRAPALEDLAAGDGEIRARGVETRRTPGGAGMELQRRGRGGFGRPWRERGERDPIRRGQTRQRLRQFPVKKNREGASGERGRSEKDKKKGGEGRGRRSTGLGARERRRSSCRCCCSRTRARGGWASGTEEVAAGGSGSRWGLAG